MGWENQTFFVSGGHARHLNQVLRTEFARDQNQNEITFGALMNALLRQTEVISVTTALDVFILEIKNLHSRIIFWLELLTNEKMTEELMQSLVGFLDTVDPSQRNVKQIISFLNLAEKQLENHFSTNPDSGSINLSFIQIRQRAKDYLEQAQKV